MNQPWKVVLAFVGVFLAGVICGGPLLDWVRERSDANRPPFAERTMRRFEKELKLTVAQKEKIEPVLLRTQTQWRQFRQENVRNLMGVIDRMHADIEVELTPEQRVKLEAISNEFRSRAERFRGRIRDQESPPAGSKSAQ
ncbi:MAG TPA: hypothetical protein VL069_00385 [Opitutus sp.]|nr:hypothetical protein [Opitutus sp.]